MSPPIIVIMLNIFNRYISRMRVDHPIFGNRDLMLLVLQYLEGEDLYYCMQVAFYWKTTIMSQPQLEVKVLRFQLKKSNKAIKTLTQRQEQPSRTPQPAPMRRLVAPPRRPKNTQAVVQKVEHWNTFIENFYQFARQKGFPVKGKSQFQDEQEWNSYKGNLENVYNNYVDHIKTARSQQVRPTLPEMITRQYRNFKQNLGLKISIMRDFKRVELSKDESFLTIH